MKLRDRMRSRELKLQRNKASEIKAATDALQDLYIEVQAEKAHKARVMKAT